MSRPDEVDCEACGGTARRIEYGTSTLANYRCDDCRSGGSISSDDVKLGPVFNGWKKRVRAGP